MTNNNFIVFYEKEEYDDYLMHYGVPGMKWGVRKAVQRVSSGAKKVGSGTKKAASSAKKSISSLAKKIKAKRAASKEEKLKKKTISKNINSSDKKKSLKDMSDSDLDTAIKRMEKEKKYTELNSALHPQKESFSSKMVKSAKEGVAQGTKTLISNQIPVIGKNIINELTKDAGKEKLGNLGQKVKTIEYEEWIKEYQKTGKRPTWKPSAK